MHSKSVLRFVWTHPSNEGGARALCCASRASKPGAGYCTGGLSPGSANGQASGPDCTATFSFPSWWAPTRRTIRRCWCGDGLCGQGTSSSMSVPTSEATRSGRVSWARKASPWSLQPILTPCWWKMSLSTAIRSRRFRPQQGRLAWVLPGSQAGGMLLNRQDPDGSVEATYGDDRLNRRRPHRRGNEDRR